MALLVGLITAPLWALAAVAVWIDLGRPILFRQERPGLGSRPFTLMKFRTMRDSGSHCAEKVSDGARITRVGRLLRSTSIDELPTLWNVVKGDMSFVGPRPLLMEYLPLYSPEQARRHEVRPGISGLAQVKGRNALSWKKKLELDVWYVDHRSALLDAKILGLTLVNVVARRGISADGHATAPRFTGQCEER